MNKRSSISIAVSVALCAAVLLISLAEPAGAQSTIRGDLSRVAMAESGPSDPRELEAFLDPIFAEQMATSHIPGAVFLLVKDGDIILAKGYGFADLGKQTPVVPDRTVFRVMSVAKPFTATAVMQLVEQGKLDLHRDVNAYLRRLQLQNSYDRPVTLADLLTHTAGLDSDLDDAGTVSRSQEEVPSLAGYLSSHPPTLISRPGERYLYSNAAYDVAGQIVEDVSGRPFAEYVEESILRPLGMRRSSFRQPSPWVGDQASSYAYVGGAYQRVPSPYVNDPPSRGLTATATDVASFLILQLEGGRYGDTRVLQEATVEDMQRQHFTAHPGMPGQAYGFDEFVEHGLRGLRKPGGGFGATSALYLLPDQRMGFFVAYNSDDGLGLVGQLAVRLFDHYYPAERQVSPSQPSPDPETGLARFAGVYHDATYSHHTVAKLRTLTWAPFPQVTAVGDGTLQLRFSDSDPSSAIPLREVEPLLFESPGGEVQVAFVEDSQSEVTHLVLGQYVAEKARWCEHPTLQQALLGLFVIIFGATTLAYPVQYVYRRRPGRSRAGPQPWRLIAILPLTVAGLNFVFLVTLAAVLLGGTSLDYGMPPVLAALLAIPIVSAGLTIALPFVGLLARRNRRWSTPVRALYWSFALVALAFIPYLTYWNLIGSSWTWQ